MVIELGALSGDELIALKRDAEKALRTLDARNRTEALKAAEAAARDHGYTLKELMSGTSARSKVGGVAKYANPEDTRQTWTGKGRQPEWFKAALTAGKNRDDMEV
jgi:DNA-binding protein H-NS